MSIFCVGQTAYDIAVPMEEPLRENKKYRITDTFECGGGPAFNAACLCGKWGAKSYLISKIGMDDHGEKIRKSLYRYNVDTKYVIQSKKIQTPYSMILVGKEKGSRTIFNFPGTCQSVEWRMPEEEPAVILSDGHEPEISIRLIKKYPGAVSVADAGTFRESTYAVAQYVDYLICSEDFAEQYTSQKIDPERPQLCRTIFQKIEQINHKHVVITLGERGLLYRKEEGSLCYLPAFPVTAIDTTGAGDIFHGAFAFGLEQNWSMEENLRFSSYAAALSVQRMGGLTSVPDLKIVFSYTKENLKEKVLCRW